MNEAEHVAKIFHRIYEQRAAEFNYETRIESRKRWEDIPENNRTLMIATVQGLLDLGIIHPASGCHYSLGRLEVAEGQITELEKSLREAYAEIADRDGDW